MNTKEHACWAAAGGHGGRVKYFKGLGGHDTADVVHLAQTFHARVSTSPQTKTPGPASNRSTARAGVAENPASAADRVPPADELAAARAAKRVTLQRMLEVDAHAYKLDDLKRKLLSVDGFTAARRKIFAGAVRRFTADAREMKETLAATSPKSWLTTTATRRLTAG